MFGRGMVETLPVSNILSMKYRPKISVVKVLNPIRLAEEMRRYRVICAGCTNERT